MASKKCPNCGSVVSSDNSFCPNCGAKLGLDLSNDLDSSFKPTIEQDDVLNQRLDPDVVQKLDADDLQLRNDPIFDEPTYSEPAQPVHTGIDEGSYAIGFVLVFFLQIIGLIIALVMKKRKTRKGAVITFLVGLGLYIIGIIGYFILVSMHIIPGFNTGN